jgi:hypothetical protein
MVLSLKKAQGQLYFTLLYHNEKVQECREPISLPYAHPWHGAVTKGLIYL